MKSLTTNHYCSHVPEDRKRNFLVLLFHEFALRLMYSVHFAFFVVDLYEAIGNKTVTFTIDGTLKIHENDNVYAVIMSTLFIGY